jgi:lipopolysaccharide/colanic/teichoic acid biosynthesis glycosyltransferase
MVKRVFDVVFAAVGLLLCSPVFALVAFCIKYDDRGPVFYRGERVGLDGIPFRIFKFRTMVVGADKIGGSSTADDDRRITHVGRVVRRYKLDELPQLINVLVGDMSLVGPRPEIRRYVDMYSEKESAILTVRPGITDWASLWNSDEGAILAGSIDPDRAYEEKVRPTKIRLQLKYVRDHSLLTDLRILLLTLMVVALRRKPDVVRQLANGT